MLWQSRGKKYFLSKFSLNREASADDVSGDFELSWIPKIAELHSTRSPNEDLLHFMLLLLMRFHPEKAKKREEEKSAAKRKPEEIYDRKWK